MSSWMNFTSRHQQILYSIFFEANGTFATYCTACCHRHWGSQNRWLLFCRAEHTGSFLCNVVQRIKHLIPKTQRAPKRIWTKTKPFLKYWSSVLQTFFSNINIILWKNNTVLSVTTCADRYLIDIRFIQYLWNIHQLWKHIAHIIISIILHNVTAESAKKLF